MGVGWGAGYTRFMCNALFNFNSNRNGASIHSIIRAFISVSAECDCRLCIHYTTHTMRCITNLMKVLHLNQININIIIYFMNSLFMITNADWVTLHSMYEIWIVLFAVAFASRRLECPAFRGRCWWFRLSPQSVKCLFYWVQLIQPFCRAMPFTPHETIRIHVSLLHYLGPQGRRFRIQHRIRYIDPEE